MRNVPDVAGLADAVIWVVANNGEQGTSVERAQRRSLWAGIAAL
jgi:hypothetical protein